MPDTKITALTAISTVNPATYPLPIVDTADTTMAASGTTKKITVNQILGSGGTATLASATITGDLTVRTNKLAVTSTGVAVGATSAAYPLDVTGIINTNSDAYVQGGRLALYRPAGASYIDIASGQDLVFRGGLTTVGGAGASDLMRLNATGLTIGGSAIGKLTAYSTTNGDILAAFRCTGTGTQRALYISADNSTGVVNLDVTGSAAGILQFKAGGTNTMQIDTSGNVGIGVTPSAWGSNYTAVELTKGASIFGAKNVPYTIVGANVYNDATNEKYAVSPNTAATKYQQTGGVHSWHNASAGAINTAITFTQAMTLDASGNLLVGTTAAAAGRLDVRRTTVGRGINYFSTASGDLAQVGLYIGKFDNDSTTSQKFIAFSINNDSAGSGQINANGANQAAFGSFSDSRLKENIVSLPSQLDNILSLRPVEFDYKDGSGHQIGFVAQEMQQVYSDAVGESDGFLTVTGWSKTEARLVSAIKELAAKVQALEAKLA